jgi:hypothetical protein
MKIKIDISIFFILVYNINETGEHFI